MGSPNTSCPISFDPSETHSASAKASEARSLRPKEALLPLCPLQSPADRGLHVLPGEQAARPDPYPASLEDGLGHPVDPEQSHEGCIGSGHLRTLGHDPGSFVGDLGDHRAHLVRAAASEPAVARAPLVLVLTGLPWRTAWKYTERGYRHLFWDAGMILANLLPLATSAGFPTRVVLGFADAGVDSLLALESRREFPLVLVPVGAGDDEVAPADGPPKEASFEFAPLSRTEFVYQGIFQANETGRLGSAEDVRLWREGWTAGEPTSGNSVPPAEVRDSLEEVIRRRGSARVFGAGSLPAATLADVLARAATPIPTDYAVNGGHLIEPYLVANDVQGLEPGAYVFRGGELRLLRAGGFRREAGFLCLEQRLGAMAAATHFLMADLGHVLGALGARGYRATQLEAGIVAGRIYLCAYAHRFGATGLTFYDDEVARFFSPDAEGKSCMLVVAVGDSPRLSCG